MTAIRTTCAYCGVGCGIRATVTGARSVEIAGDPDHPANRGRLCSKGTHLGETVGLEGRLLHPMIGGKRASWDKALDLVAYNALTGDEPGRGTDASRFTPPVAGDEVGADAVEPRPRVLATEVVARSLLEGDPEELPEQPLGILHPDAAHEVAEQDRGVAVEERAEAARIVERCRDHLGVGADLHPLHVPRSRAAVRG